MDMAPRVGIMVVRLLRLLGAGLLELIRRVDPEKLVARKHSKEVAIVTVSVNVEGLRACLE